ncbi:hypothetical protein KOW79_005721 [Hemibagrus wyckioides]|uniref:Uncharacterized protein n=1 Tax=Hemibagrus wyckioides TaxID=337641 RepID=A0A9D3P009_9TELE|nr:hypothetical protein KOW79_005721 [Hemibagrus wyckioides]
MTLSHRRSDRIRVGALETANTSSGEKSATAPVATYSRNHGDGDSGAEAAIKDKHKEQYRTNHISTPRRRDDPGKKRKSFGPVGFIPISSFS